MLHSVLFGDGVCIRRSAAATLMVMPLPVRLLLDGDKTIIGQDERCLN
ncbi:hypothetical protein [Edwardsiella tarda]|nr:hypothetical protein [Edwardsiella tarda]